MDTIRKTLELAVSNQEAVLAQSDGTRDGPIIDALRLTQTALDMANSMKGARRWIPVDERLPSTEGRYEVVVDNKVNYCYYCTRGFSAHGEVTYWRKQPKFPKG